MSTNRLIQLPKFSYTSLDFDTIVEDVKKLIKEHPEYNQQWDDFLETNAGRMFVETMAYVIEKMASRVDWISQELFLSTATQRQSLINILELINHRPALPKAAKVNMKLKLTKWSEPFMLNKRETILGIDTNGNPIKFELVRLASDGKPDYDFQYTVESGTVDDKITEIYNVPFYEGITYTEDDIYMDGVDNESIQLQYFPVIEGSIRVFNYGSNIEYPEVTSFISPEAQQTDLSESEKLPPYVIGIDAENKVTVKFGPNSLVKTPTKGERIKILYRVGGGTKSNIVTNAINSTKTYNLDNNRRVTIIFSNPNPGFGGYDEERLEDAKLTAPISLRSANKTVTREDYISHLELSPLVLHAQVVGKENEPREFFDEYGYNFPPLDSWLYVTPQKDNINDINPIYFNKQLQISRPYNIHAAVESEEVVFTNQNQKVYLKKFRNFAGYELYLTPSNNLTAANPYQKDVDYTLNEMNGSITRIATGDGGTIPAGEQHILVRYITDDTVSDFKQNTVFTFNPTTLTIDTQPNSIFPNFPITVTKSNGTIYVENTDYEINYSTGLVSIKNGGHISSGETVAIYYAANWISQQEDDNSEEKAILDIIADKKMICIDNYIKDSRYSTFDIAATIYCFKNLRTKVEADLRSYLRNIYNIENRNYMEDIGKDTIIKDIMKFDGVRGLDITYLGKNYEAYRRYILGDLTLEELNGMDASKVEHKIEARYNEILILANDTWDGQQIVDNQRTGLIFTFKEA